MKKIGFVDYFIDEWHSSNYIGWIDELSKTKGFDCEVAYAWAETDTYEGKMSTDEWCEKYGIKKCKTIEELCEKSDYIMILSPGNPEKHLKYAEEVLKYQKNTYIDKTFAPDKQVAEAIFALGEKYNTKFFSTSALRYASELDAYKDGINSVIITGGGRSFEEYIIHQIEMLVKMMGIGAEKVKVFSSGKQKVCVVKHADGREGFLEYSSVNPFTIVVEDKGGNDQRIEITSSFFMALLEDILKFFESGNPPVAKEQTIEVIAIRDALIKAINNPDEWINI